MSQILVFKPKMLLLFLYLLFLFFYVILGAHLGLLMLDNQTAAMTGGLVQQTNHITLPTVQPIVTLVTTLMAIIVSYAME